MKRFFLFIGLINLVACDYQPQETLIDITEGETFVLNSQEVLVFEKLESDSRCQFVNPCDAENGEAKVRLVYQEKYNTRWVSKEHILSTKPRKFLGITINNRFSTDYEQFTLKGVQKDANGKYMVSLKVEELPQNYDDDYYYKAEKP